MLARTRLISSICAVIFVTFAQRAVGQVAADASGPTTAEISVAPIAPAAPSVMGPQAGPTMRALTVGVQRESSPLSASDMAVAAQRRNAGLGQAQAMMIVGGAAILVGAIVGDSPGQIIMIGGAVVGLVGLYKYLQ